MNIRTDIINYKIISSMVYWTIKGLIPKNEFSYKNCKIADGTDRQFVIKATQCDTKMYSKSMKDLIIQESDKPNRLYQL